MAAPVGKSSTYAPARPAPLATMPALQAIGSTIRMRREKIEPMTAGTIRKLNTSSTPAVVTELATTSPKDRKNRKSQTETASALRPAGLVSLETASIGLRTNQ